MQDYQYSEIHGKHGSFFWIESNGLSTGELLDVCPEVVVDKFCVQTYADSSFLVPIGKPQGIAWEHWFDKAIMGFIISLEQFRSDAYDEFYFFENTVDPQIFYNIPDDQLGMTMKTLDSSDESEIFWKRIESIDPYTFLNDGNLFRYITKDELSFKRFLESETVKKLPEKRDLEVIAAKEGWLKNIGKEVGPEKCRKDSCDKLRMMQSFFCGKHQLEMLADSNPYFE